MHQMQQLLRRHQTTTMKKQSLSHLDFNLLLDLDALLREGSVVGAARVLHLSAPAMSRRLMRLREAVGDPLFVPAGRGLVPTPRALALKDRVAAAIYDVRGIFATEALNLGEVQRTFTLRVNDGFLGAWATELTARLIAEAPGLTLNFVARADKNIDPLRHGEVDLDIGVPGPAESEICTERLFMTSFVGAVRKRHPLLRQKTDAQVTAQDYVTWPHIAAPRRGDAAGRIDTALRALGLSRQVVIVAPGFHAALVMAATSDFIATVPEPFVRWAMTSQKLETFKLPVTLPHVEVTQTWHRRHQTDPLHCWLRGQVQRMCNDVLSPPISPATN
jgi:DNA-binding transcriptional LysR family regulator